MKKYLIIVLFIFLAIPLLMAIFSSREPKIAIDEVKTELKHTIKEDPKTEVLGIVDTEGEVVPFYTMGSKHVECHMPDGKIAMATVQDCEATKKFWAEQKHANPAPQGTASNPAPSSSSTSSTTNVPTSTPTPTVVPTPTEPEVTITSAEIMPCTSSSCGSYKTIVVKGTNFTNDALFELTASGVTYSANSTFNNTPDAQKTGGNGSTEIIMDYYNLPACTTYGVQVVFPGGKKVIASNTISTPC